MRPRSRADGWVRTGDLAFEHDGELLRHRPVEGDHLRQRPELLPARSRGAAADRAGARARQGRRRGARARRARRPTSSCCSCCTAPTWPTSCRSRRGPRTYVNEHAGVEVARVVPVKRMPKTTSGKLQRTALAEAYEDGEFARTSRSSIARWPRSTVTAGPPRARSSASSRRSSTTRCPASTSTSTTTCSTSARARSR